MKMSMMEENSATTKAKKYKPEDSESITDVSDMRRNDSEETIEDSKPMKISKQMLSDCMKDLQVEDRMKWKLENCSKEELEKMIEMAQEKLKNKDYNNSDSPAPISTKY